MITVSIIGVGSRGGHTYGTYMNTQKDKFQLVSLCDVSQTRLQLFGDAFGILPENRFLDEDLFFAVKRSQLLVISTLDQDHVRIAKKAIRLGYDLLLEKPIAPTRKECLDLLKEGQKYHAFVMVCHVLRYTVAFAKIRELLDQRVIGDLVMIDHIEQVGFRHDAHSYVRGNWRNTKETSPMILAKSCHDMDLLRYFTQSRCKTISSVGDLVHFRKENRPPEATERCLQCPLQDSCPYSAKLIYLDGFAKSADPQGWPFNVLATGNLTLDVLAKALTEGPYGRCVYDCDNDVVDHQAVMMSFENGVKATFRMTAFTKYGGRLIRFYGTKGELELDETAGEIRIRPFLGNDQVLRIQDLSPGTSGHGGGDDRMIDALYATLTNQSGKIETSLKDSLESHLMAFAAEESRLKGGKQIRIRR